MKTLSIDLETFSPVKINQTGVYPYAAHPDFEILLFAYSVDSGPVSVLDLASGDELPGEITDALKDPTITKYAWNAAFERVCLSSFLGTPLDPKGWKCTMVWAASLGLPLSLDGAAKALNVEQQKLSTGKALIRRFCQPVRPTKANGMKERLGPADDPTRWAQFIEYNRRDVEAELEIQSRLKAFPMVEWETYWLDQRINDRGVLIDATLVDRAIETAEAHRQACLERACELTGLENPNSPTQLREWLLASGCEIPDLRAATVAEALKEARGVTAEVLRLRQELSRSSVKKYQAMQKVAGADGRARGLFQFQGANRTGRWAGRLIQLQNLPRNYLADLDVARDLVREGFGDCVEMLYGSLPDTLSQLTRTALIPKPGTRFVVADYSAIEARVIAWLAGEKWRLELFEKGGDIYCQSAAQMFRVPVEKHGVNAELRQKGKIAELACGYGGSTGALKAMGALEMGLEEAELQPLVDAWRGSNPRIVRLWWAVDEAVKKTVKTGAPTTVGPLRFAVSKGLLFIELPSKRRLAYVRPRIGVNKFGGESVTYLGTDGVSRRWTRLESYGPKFVENIVQAISRDLLAEGMHKIDAAGLEIVMHVHDEVVVESGRASVEEVSRLLCDAPDWAADLPLAADGYLCSYYQKD